MRRGLHVFLSQEAHSGLGDWARLNRVTVAAAVEAFALLVAEDRLTTARLARLAREVDAERRSRKP